MDKGIKTYIHRYKSYRFELEIPHNDSIEEHEQENQREEKDTD